MRKVIIILLSMLVFSGISYPNEVELPLSESAVLRPASGSNQILIKFDNLPEDLTTNSRILRAEVEIYLDLTASLESTDNMVDLKIERVAKPWTATSVNYSTFYDGRGNAVDESDYNVDQLAVDDGKMVLDVTHYLEKWLENPDENYGLVIKTFTAGADIEAAEPRMMVTGERSFGQLRIKYSPDRAK